MLMWTTMMCGLLTELWSRPHKNPDTRRFDMERWQGDTRPVSPGKSWVELDDDQMHKRAVYTRLRRRNYILRMVPHVIGIFPYTAAWVIVVSCRSIVPVHSAFAHMRSHAPAIADQQFLRPA